MIRKADESLNKLPIAYIIYGILAVGLIIRGFYGFCQSDESFYVSTAGRFAAGDLIFVDEWHPTQLASLVTMPFYMIFTAVTGGTTGILLYFRVLYVLFTTVEAYAVYRILSGKTGVKGSMAGRRIYRTIPALAAGLFLMLYCHLNIPTLSYYTMSFHFFALSFIVMYAGLGEDSAEEAKRKGGRVYFIVAGIFFALSVLCLPTLVFAAFFAAVLLVAACIPAGVLRRPLLFFMLGIMIPMLCFVIYLYASGNSIAGLLANLPYIISDGEHDRGYVESVKVFFRAISDVFGRIYYISIVMVILALLTYVNPRLRRDLRPYFLISDLVLFIYYTSLAFTHTGYMNTAFALFVFPLFFLTEKKDWYIFLSLFSGGLVFSMTYSLSSFCDLYVLSIGHGLAAFGGILLLWDLMMELHSGRDDDSEENAEICALWKKYALPVLTAAAGVFLIITMMLRFINVYRDDRLSCLDSRIDRGPAAGLFTSSSHRDQYDAVLVSIMKYTSGGDENAVQGKNGGKVLFSKLLPWGYTASGMRVAAPDTWRNMISSERLSLYYETHEMPDTVFILNADTASFEDTNDVEADPAPNINEVEGEFADLLKSEYEEHIENNCIVYTRIKR